MTIQLRRRMLAYASLTVAAALSTTPAHADMNVEVLAKIAQKPLGND